MSVDGGFLYVISENTRDHTLYLQPVGKWDESYLRPPRYDLSEMDRIKKEILERPNAYVHSIEVGNDVVIFTNVTDYCVDVRPVPKHVVSYMAHLNDAGISLNFCTILRAINSDPALYNSVYFRFCVHTPSVMIDVIEKFKADFHKPMKSTVAAGAAQSSALEEGEGGGWVSVKRPCDDSSSLIKKFEPYTKIREERPSTKLFFQFLKENFLHALPIPERITSTDVRHACADFIAMYSHLKHNKGIKRVFMGYITNP